MAAIGNNKICLAELQISSVQKLLSGLKFNIVSMTLYKVCVFVFLKSKMATM